MADELIKTIGYNAFSYADISKQLNIKNAAIHYYFPTKSDCKPSANPVFAQ
ncbi:AcrR family transcriptional regulator [Bacteroides reticulotermitis]|uniref:AcrR family transcriptional regulator n=1 Tax=Bacteroides reticulotermitis TaxID=1133319 RepID=A0A840D3N7_9BACE|nr:TetR/AcrR family transcriptional regulator [Bacteroides reticulotermitis]MBB4046226.1 AcrR family transcriptional regulator [Bacteroides reticulotermitis]